MIFIYIYIYIYTIHYSTTLNGYGSRFMSQPGPAYPPVGSTAQGPGLKTIKIPDSLGRSWAHVLVALGGAGAL